MHWIVSLEMGLWTCLFNRVPEESCARSRLGTVGAGSAPQLLWNHPSMLKSKLNTSNILQRDSPMEFQLPQDWHWRWNITTDLIWIWYGLSKRWDVLDELLLLKQIPDQLSPWNKKSICFFPSGSRDGLGVGKRKDEDRETGTLDFTCEESHLWSLVPMIL